MTHGGAGPHWIKTSCKYNLIDAHRGGKRLIHVELSTRLKECTMQFYNTCKSLPWWSVNFRHYSVTYHIPMKCLHSTQMPFYHPAISRQIGDFPHWAPLRAPYCPWVLVMVMVSLWLSPAHWWMSIVLLLWYHGNTGKCSLNEPDGQSYEEILSLFFKSMG